VGILVVLLVAAWGLVLGPALLQSVGNSPVDSERVFKRSLSALGRKQRQPVLGGRSILVPPKSPYPLSGPVHFGKAQKVTSSRSAAMRRRKNLTNLAVFIIATFLLGFIPPLHFMLFINLVADVALIAYIGLALYMAIWPPPEREQAPVATHEAPPPAAAADGSF
jgi:hypothetical protein